MYRQYRLLVAAAAAVFVTTHALAQDKVTFALDWVISGQHAPLIMAKQKGFYKEVGLDVDIVRGYGSADAVKRVAAETVTFGFGDTGALMLARADGIEVKVVAMIYGDAPYSLVVREDAGIDKPTDLEGKKLAGPAGGAGRAMFPIFAKQTGIDLDKIEWVTVDAANLLPVMISGQAVGIATYYVQHVTDEARLAEAGVPARSIKYSDYGVHMYSNGLLARDKTIEEDPQLVERFVRATLRGVHYAFAHPEEAAKALVSMHPQLDEELVIGDVATVKALALTPEAKQHGLGYMVNDKMIRTKDIIAEVYDAKKAKELDIKAVYTNRFLRKQ